MFPKVPAVDSPGQLSILNPFSLFCKRGVSLYEKRSLGHGQSNVVPRVLYLLVSRKERGDKPGDEFVCENHREGG